ncbi:helix-turn-helix transcriptional regulator [Streptococcus hyovaginalis]|uniref:helix-turn-helix transcriptional regulator n=1 Tax=Streptococcus hyovaginalis TaxID=149015 RepID=UPI003BF852C8
MQVLLYELRKKSNLKQSDMAKVIHKSEVTYRDKELGKRDFTLSEMYAIANFFKRDVGDIFTDTTSRNVNN